MWSEGEMGKVKSLLKLSCEDSTWGGYEKSWELWKEHMAKKCRGNKEDVFMKELGEKDKQIRIVLFMSELYEENGLRKQRIGSVLAAICAKFEAAAEDSSAFGSKMVARAKKGTVGSNEEIKEINRTKLENPTLPMALDMVLKGRELLWSSSNWSAGGMNSKGRWIVIGLGFNFGSRIGQLTLTPKKKDKSLVRADHCLRAGDIKFHVRGLSNVLQVFKGGRPMRGYLGGTSGEGSESVRKRIGRVEKIEFSCLTSKTTRKKKVTNVVDILKIGRSSAEEGMLLEDLCEWMLYAAPEEEDEAMCRYDPTNRRNRKVVTACEVKVAIKSIARSLCLPEKLFSTKSLRSGLSSHMNAMGRSDEDIHRAGGWVEGSKVVRRHYTHKDGIVGAMASVKGERGDWGTEQVMDLVQRRNL